VVTAVCGDRCPQRSEPAHRKALPEAARDIALECCVYEHEKSCWLDSVVIMPNHGHMTIAPYDEWPLQKIMERWKRVASHRIKKACDIREVWERESFDHMLRSDESMRQKSEYVCQNPVRAGFVRHPDEWRWLWRSWVEGAREEAARCAPL
jgi:REP element-mobilizing transposase RayT